MSDNTIKMYHEESNEDNERQHLLIEETNVNNGNPIPIYEIGNFLDKTTARQYYEKYLENPNLVTSAGLPIKCVLLGKGDLLKVLLQPECHGLRVYFGKDEKNRLKLMYVGVYKDGKNMVRHTLIGNGGYDCPDSCPPGGYGGDGPYGD